MKLKNSVISLLFGVVGGLLAFGATTVFRTQKPERPEIRHEVTGPGIKQVVYRPDEEPFTGGAGSVDLRLAAKKAVPGVVHVKTIQMGREYYGNPLSYFFGGTLQSREVPRTAGYGSGVIISPDGFIVTNNHVIRDAHRVMVVTNDRKEYEAKVIGQDPTTDIALLKIEAQEMPAVEYGNSDQVSLGEWVLAVGNPYNLTSTVTAGIISAKGRDLGVNREQMSLESFLQTDAAINPGNSGGALVNADGKLVGINTLIQSPTGAFSGYAFAIPVNIVRKVVNDLKEYGQVQKAQLGIRMGEVTPAFAEEYDLKETSGIYVNSLINGGAAQKAGIKQGDIIRGINGYGIKSTSDLFEQLGKYNPGSVVQLKINRDGKEMLVDVTLLSATGGVAPVCSSMD